MKILKENPKKSSVTLTQETLEIEGKTTKRILSGYGGDGAIYGFYGRRNSQNHEEEIKNPVFSARIKCTGSSRGRSSFITIWEDDDGIHKYHAGPATTLEMIQAIQSGNLTFDNGYLKGDFTFVFQGNNSYIRPYVDKAI